MWNFKKGNATYIDVMFGREIGYYDFYDLLLAKYYGIMQEGRDGGVVVRVYYWKGKYYVEEVK